MSTWGSARRVRIANLRLWLAKWNTYGMCGHCHQPAGIPCLSLAAKCDDLFESQPHQGRTTTVTEPT